MADKLIKNGSRAANPAGLPSGTCYENEKIIQYPHPRLKISGTKLKNPRAMPAYVPRVAPLPLWEVHKGNMRKILNQRFLS